MYEDKVGYFFNRAGWQYSYILQHNEKKNQVVEICYIVYTAYHECIVGSDIQPTRAVRQYSLQYIFLFMQILLVDSSCLNII